MIEQVYCGLLQINFAASWKLNRLMRANIFLFLTRVPTIQQQAIIIKEVSQTHKCYSPKTPPSQTFLRGRERLCVWVNKWERNETNKILINIIFLMKLGRQLRKHHRLHTACGLQFAHDCTRHFCTWFTVSPTFCIWYCSIILHTHRCFSFIFSILRNNTKGLEIFKTGADNLAHSTHQFFYTQVQMQALYQSCTAINSYQNIYVNILNIFIWFIDLI